tara:strand:- start:1193 stop:1615 length:423 start_codon:yes stop_codon:yes gene_type:complete
MEVQFRPYTIMAQIATTDGSSIPLRDTANEPLDCNYVSVETSSAAGNRTQIVTVSYAATGVTTPLENQSPASSVIGATSGMVGGTCKINGGVVELLLSDAERTNTIFVQPSEDEIFNAIITYGQIQRGNPGRDNLRPIGS